MKLETENVKETAATVELIRERCGGGDPLSDDLAIPPVWYR